MGNWVKRLILLSLTALVNSDKNSLIVDHPKREEKVFLGSTLTLSCSFKAVDRVTVNWCFTNSTEPSSNICSECSYKLNFESGKKTRSEFKLTNVTRNDSGWYFCEVTDLIQFNRGCSNGTHVVILDSTMEGTMNFNVSVMMPTQETPKDAGDGDWLLLYDWRFWVILGASSASLVLIALLSILYVLLRRRRRRNRESPIYSNTRPVGLRYTNRQPSPRPGMQLDTLKTIPPSKNLQTPTPSRKQEAKWSPKQ